MKRLLFHISFWIIYSLLDILLHITWMESSVPHASRNLQILMAVQSALVLLPPKLIMVYYLLCFRVNDWVQGTRNKSWLLIEFGIMFILTLVLFRIIFNYILLRNIYGLPLNISIFNPRFTIIAIIEMGFITGIACTIKLLHEHGLAKEREKELEKEKLHTELKFLRNQTNPHFLFNTLNNIYALARKKSDLTADAVLRLSDLLSFMLYDSSKQLIPITDEVKMIIDYIDLEKLRYSERLKITFTTDIDNNSTEIAPLLLLPLVENAFKHGVSENRFDAFVKIDIKLIEHQFYFQIANSKEKQKEDTEQGQIGLTNVKRQLELMYKDHNYKIDQDDNVFIVTIEINLRSYGNI